MIIELLRWKCLAANHYCISSSERIGYNNCLVIQSMHSILFLPSSSFISSTPFSSKPTPTPPLPNLLLLLLILLLLLLLLLLPLLHPLLLLLLLLGNLQSRLLTFIDWSLVSRHNEFMTTLCILHYTLRHYNYNINSKNNNCIVVVAITTSCIAPLVTSHFHFCNPNARSGQ